MYPPRAQMTASTHWRMESNKFLMTYGGTSFHAAFIITHISSSFIGVILGIAVIFS